MSTTRRGAFITFEGGEGAGKSTQIALLAAHLRSRGHEVVETAEPGGTPIGKQIRRIFLDAANHELAPMAELLLVFAARAQHIEQVIAPALAGGRIVLCDRFTDSTWVYQGVVRGLGTERVRTVDGIACGGMKPDLTLLLDIPAELGLERARARNAAQEANPETRLDDQEIGFHRKVREGYLELARLEPERIRVIEAGRSRGAVSAQVREEVDRIVAAIKPAR